MSRCAASVSIWERGGQKYLHISMLCPGKLRYFPLAPLTSGDAASQSDRGNPTRRGWEGSLETVIMGCLSQERLKGPPSRAGEGRPGQCLRRSPWRRGLGSYGNCKTKQQPGFCNSTEDFPGPGGPACHPAHSRSVQVLGRAGGRG